MRRINAAQMRPRHARRERPAMSVRNVSFSLLSLLVGCSIKSPNLFNDMHPVERKFFRYRLSLVVFV